MSVDQRVTEKIDAMGYESMLQLWRNAPAGHYMFQGDTGDYFSKVMAEKKSAISDGDHVAASKSVGWSGS